ncbi:MAG: hypothetical protein IJE07_12180 [Clostridia bacterium]|nr:hypothetical protein [Clostridia bacterium]
MLDPCHARTPQHLQLGEGVLLRNVDLDEALASGDPAAFLAAAMQEESHLIGATKAGCEFRCVPIVLDATRGSRTPAPGETLLGRWEVSLSGTLLEISPGNAAMLLNQPACESADGMAILRPVPAAAPESCGDLCWVGDTGGGLLAIGLHCPISIGGLVLRANRDGLGEAPFTLMAQKRSPAETGLPCRLVWLEVADT